jgi:hypothetical protein
MKLIVTENQFSKIKLVKESQEYTERYKQFCSEMSNEVDKIYNKIMGLTLDELLRNDSLVNDLYKKVSKIENDVYSAEKNMTSLWDKGLIEPDNDEFDMFIDDVANTVTDKLSPLTSLIMDLERLKNDVDDNNFFERFKHIKPIQIQSF